MISDALLNIGVHCRAVTGEQVSGDQGGFWALPGQQYLLCLIDGLGHGAEAHRAAADCLDLVAQYRKQSLAQIFALCNQGIRETRGVALSLALVDISVGRLDYAGVGNVSACLISDRARRMTNHPGIVGNEDRLEIQVFEHSYVAGRDRFVMHSDGIDDLLAYADLPFSRYACGHDMAAALVAEHAIERDDASALVVM